MHHRARAVLATIAALLVSGPVHAEDAAPAPVAPPAAPAPQVIVDNPMADLPAKAVDASERFAWQPFGFLRMQYRFVQNDPSVDFIGRDDGFLLQNARVGVVGALGHKASFVVALEGAVDEREARNDPQGHYRVALRDAYVDVPVRGRLAVRAGLFRTLTDPDLDATTRRPFVDRPLESRGVEPTEGYETDGLAPTRSVGAALRYDPGAPHAGARLGFELAVQNGGDEYASDNDNDLPAVSVSLFARLPHESWIVASARYNRRTEGDLPFRQDEDDLQATLGVRIATGPILLGAGATVVRTLFPTVDGPARDTYGAHGQLVFRTGGALPLAFGYRFGVLDPSSLVLTDRVLEHTVGGVLELPSYRARLLLQATHVMDQRDLTNDRVQLAAEISL